MATKRELQALIVLAGKVDPSLQRALNVAAKGSDNLASKYTKAGKNMSRLGDIIKGSFVGNLAANFATRAIDQIEQLGIKGITLASDLKEVQNVVDVTFGNGASQINQWSQGALKAYGLSELAAKQYTGTMGAMLKSSRVADKDITKMSTNLAGLSGDMASFFNISQDNAWEKIRAGIAGETEPLRQLGINMTVANLQAFALSKGIKTSYDKMDQASQMTLRYNYLLEASKDAQGDFARTQGSFANQTRLLKTNFEQLSAKVMSAALPSLEKLMQLGNKLMDGVMGNPEKLQKFQDMISNGLQFMIINVPKVIGFLDKISPLIWGIVAAQTAWNLRVKAGAIINGIIKAWEYGSTVLSLLRTGTSLAAIAQMELNLAMAANPIGLIVLGIGAAVAAVVLLYKNWDKVWKFISTTARKIKEFFTGSASPSTTTKITTQEQRTALVANAYKYKKFASGGFTNKPAVFGDAGREVAIPIKYKSPRSLSLLSQTAKAIGADAVNKASVIVHLTIQAAGGTSDDIKKGAVMARDYIIEVLDEYFDDKGRESFG